MDRTPSTGGGLQAPKSLGISMTELDRIVEKFHTQPSVEEDLKKMGITNPPQPQFELQQITAEMLSTVDDVAFTAMYSQQLAWQNYVSPVLAKVTASLLQEETKLKLIGAAIKKHIREQNLLREKKDKLTEDDIENEILTDPVYQETLLEAQRHKQMKLSLEVAEQIAGRNLRVISRQVEIRKEAFEAHQREGNMGYGGARVPGPLGGRR